MAADLEPVGYTHLCWKYRIRAENLRQQGFIEPESTRSARHTTNETTVRWFPPHLRPDDADFSHLIFALKHEGVDLYALSKIAPALDPAELSSGVARQPTSAYGRRAFFLYELLTGERLPLPDLVHGNYCDVLDPGQYYVASGRRSRRHRVNDNLLGDSEFCPLVRRTPALAALAQQELDVRAHTIAEDVPPALLARTTWYLYGKETKASFEIEHEETGNRIERYVQQLRGVAALPLDTERGLTELQNSLVDRRFQDAGYRKPGDDEVYVGETIGLREKIHHIGLRSDLVPPLMSAWSRMRAVEGLGAAVVEAACRSFSFVFIHPFSDGNGRIHRLLLHHVLARRHFMPASLVVPISSVILSDLQGYDTALEAFSARPMDPVVTQYTLDEEGRVSVQKQDEDFFRFPDLTLQCEATFGWLQRAIDEELLPELDFLRRYDEVRARMREIVEMPDRHEQLFIKLCLQNRGRLSKRKRATFDMLEDDVVAELEAVVREEMGALAERGLD